METIPTSNSLHLLKFVPIRLKHNYNFHSKRRKSYICTPPHSLLLELFSAVWDLHILPPILQYVQAFGEVRITPILQIRNYFEEDRVSCMRIYYPTNKQTCRTFQKLLRRLIQWIISCMHQLHTRNIKVTCGKHVPIHFFLWVGKFNHLLSSTYT